MENKKVRKLIDLPNDTCDKINILAEADRRKPKPFIEKIIIDYCNLKTKENGKIKI